MKKIGLALAGGGALGAYEVGAHKFLEEQGYKFDIITGTSIGALNGAFITTGNIQKMRDLWSDITPDKIMVDGINLKYDIKYNFNEPDLGPFLKRYLTNKGADITPFKKLIKKYVDPSAIKKSKRKLGIITTTFPALKEVKLAVNELPENKIIPFLHASSACFPFFPIEEIDGVKYVDGFYRNNLPIDYCFELGADEVVAIDLKLFGSKAQNFYLTQMSNVTYISPNVSLGSMLDFTQETIQKNIKRGYHDAMKKFNKARGYVYTFYDDPKFDLLAKRFFDILIKHEYDGTIRARKFLYEQSLEENTPFNKSDSLLIIALEHLAWKYEIPDEEIYDVVDFYKLILQASDKKQLSLRRFITRARNYVSEAINEEKININEKGSLNQDDNLLIYLEYAFKRVK